MYVQTYLDLFHREVSCGLLFFLARATASLAGGFLVAVVGCALVAVVCCFLLLRDFPFRGSYMVVSPSHLHNGLRPN